MKFSRIFVDFGLEFCNFVNADDQFRIVELVKFAERGERFAQIKG